MKITIAGYGFVGRAHDEVMRNYHNITIVDPAFIEHTKPIPQDSQGLIVCVSTPPHESGACNVNNLYTVIGATPKTTPILIKSTISLEGWQTIREDFPNHSLTFSPEFLVAKTATEDFKNTKHLYFGGDDAVFWSNVFNRVFDGLEWSTASVESLIVGKYMRNSFLATKVAFFNQMYDLCEAYGLDYDQAVAVVGSDLRIGMSHTTITPERGFGGHCFPKDTSAIVKTAQRNNVELSLIEEAIAYNNRIRKA